MNILYYYLNIYARNEILTISAKYYGEFYTASLKINTPKIQLLPSTFKAPKLEVNVSKLK